MQLPTAAVPRSGIDPAGGNASDFMFIEPSMERTRIERPRYFHETVYRRFYSVKSAA